MKLVLKINEDMYEDFGEFNSFEKADMVAKLLCQIKEVKYDDFYILED